MGHQLPYVVRHYLAKHLRLAETDVRVIIPHTGGGFGQKASIYPEELVWAHLALTLRHPVKWVEDRIENMVASTHARDQYIELELAADPRWPHPGDQLRYLGRCRRLLHLSLVSRDGAAADRGLDVPVPTRIGAMRYRTRGVATNKTPVGPYRAVGRPSASASLELLIDEMARRLKLDPVEVRLRNLIPIEEMPYRNANNLVHDNVNYVPCLKLSVANPTMNGSAASSAKPVPMASSAALASPASRSSPASAPARLSVPARFFSPGATLSRSAWKPPAS